MSENQNEVFTLVRDSMVNELSEGMRIWDFQMMLARLSDEISKINLQGRMSYKIRSFSRHYLGLSGNRYTLVKQWIDRTLAMSDSDIRLVLKTLLQLEKGTFPAVKPLSGTASKRSRERASRPVNAGVGAGARRKFVDLIISTLNSFVGVITEMDLTSDEVFDGDRMQVIPAMENICSAMGIDAKLSRLNEDNSVPVKSSDMKQLMKGKS